MPDTNNRLAVTITENKINNAIIPLWNKVQLGFHGSRFDLNNLIKELKAIKDHINSDMNSKGLALKDVTVTVEFYPDFQSQTFKLERFIEANIYNPETTGLAFQAGIEKIISTLVTNKSININMIDAEFLFGIKSLVSNDKLDTIQFKALVESVYDKYHVY
jgi:hypothetical protein